jgi:hypothetical protein
MAITNISSIQLNRSIVDEIHVRSATDASINLTSSHDQWQIDTYLLAPFQNTLSAGSIDNGGNIIDKFAIQRRELTDTTNITLGYVDFEQGQTISYTDYTQANRTYVYSIVPVAVNGLLGQPNSVQINSSFTGWWLVDKDTGSILGFDKTINSMPMVSTQLQQGRIEVQTMSPYPNVYYTPTRYHKFTLQTVFVPSEFDNSNSVYQNLLSKFVDPHIPILVKGSDGSMFIVDVSSPKRDVPMNAYKGFDYITVSVDCIEIMSVDDYFNQ